MQRKQMVRSQIEARGVRNQEVLKALLKVERHLFVPENVRYQSYLDGPLPIGEGQTISQPYIVALMTELLEPDSGMKVLEIGTGSGYQAAILGELCKEVYTIEIVPSLYASATATLEKLEYTNVHTRLGDGFAGWPEQAPFDGIIVTCAPKKVPPPLLDQMAEGGRLVIPVGKFWQELKVLEKKEGKIRERDVIPVRFVPMTGEAEEM
ncbi:protein-L-isoaspartate(D-aspartate) O-methyltransferase [bacterium]|nr:protein-L-isoaspartate(D-aspartate) O-methyltransferase [candidate division CSSED10-310 bacterium]